MNQIVTVPISLASANQKKGVSASEYQIKSKVFHNLKPQNGEKILDIGCGDGDIAFQIKKLGCQVLGIDINPARIEATRAKGVDALLINAEDMFFDKEYDAVFSMSALHWMRRPDMVLEAINRALKPQGRFVAEISAYGNLQSVLDSFLEVLSEQGKPGLHLIPWYLPTQDDYQERLEKNGFTVKKIETNRKSFGIKGALSSFVQSFLPIFKDVIENRQDFIESVVAKLEKRLEIKKDYYHVEYVSIDFVAVKEKDIA